MGQTSMQIHMFEFGAVLANHFVTPLSSLIFSLKSSTSHVQGTVDFVANSRKNLQKRMSSNESWKIWTGLWRCAIKGAPSSPQSNSAKHGSKTLQRESMK
jgi:hypothetical protein